MLKVEKKYRQKLRQKYGFGKRQLKGKQKPDQRENQKNSQQPVADG